MKIRLVCVATHSKSADVLMRGQLRYMVSRGYDVVVVTAPGPALARLAVRERVETVGIRMEREIAIWQDLRALFSLIRLFRKLRPTIVNAGTPKAGFLAMIAACLTRVPVRIYTLRGLRLSTVRPGLKRSVLELSEKIASRAAHAVLSVSNSLREEYVQLGLAPPSKVLVLGEGSSNGVAAERPVEGGQPDTGVASLLSTDFIYVGFIGRLTRDKGIVELVAAFQTVSRRCPAARLVIVGEAESGDPLPMVTLDQIRENERIIHLGWVEDPFEIYVWLRALAFPSHREGFPNVPLEAAAVGVPTVGFSVTGTVDAVISGKTGILVEKGDVEGLANALAAYVEDVRLAETHGQAARARVNESFRRERVWANLEGLYRDLLKKRGVVTLTSSGSKSLI